MSSTILPKIIAVGVAVLAFSAFDGVAQASTIIPTDDVLSNLVYQSQATGTPHGAGSTLDTLTAGLPSTAGYNYTASFTNQQGLSGSVDVGQSLSDISYTGDDVLGLYITNQNQNTWIYQLTAVTDHGTVVSDPLTVLITDTAFLSVILPAVSGVLESFSITIAPTVDLFTDPQAQFAVNDVPLPGTLLLFGSALIGLGVLALRKKSKAVEADPAVA